MGCKTTKWIDSTVAAPIGNRNAAKAREWGDAVRAELKAYESQVSGIKRGQALRNLASASVR